MASPTDLWDFADELLSFAAEALDTIPTFDATLEGAPDRQVVSQGTPSDDCDQLTVYVPSIGEAGTTPGGLAAEARTRVGHIDLVTYNIRIIRCCLPVGNDVGDPPLAAEISDASKQTYADAWALWNHLHNVKSSGQILTLCDEMYFDGMIAVLSSGGCGGWVVPVRARLEGYADALGSGS